jgi:hypothetical protein
MCSWVKHTLTSGGGTVRAWTQWFPFWELKWCKSPKYLEPLLKKQTSTKLGLQNTIGKVSKCTCLKCPCFDHLDLKCMNYDQKEGQESNWEFDSWPQIPLKQESNDLQWGKQYIVEKIFLGVISYYLFLLQTSFVWGRYGHPKFRDNKIPNFGTFTWESQEKISFGCSLTKSHIVNYREGNGDSFQRLHVV